MTRSITAMGFKSVLHLWTNDLEKYEYPIHWPTTALTPHGRIVVSLDRKCFGASSRIQARPRRCCPEAFSIRRLEGRRWQWRALLWSYDCQLACMVVAKRLEEADWIRRQGRYIVQEGAIL